MFFQAFRNIPVVDLCNIGCLNLLQLAPCGQVGRPVVYNEGAFEFLGSWLEGKKAPQVIMKNSGNNSFYRDWSPSIMKS